jgi:hypothetical protein
MIVSIVTIHGEACAPILLSAMFIQLCSASKCIYLTQNTSIYIRDRHQGRAALLPCPVLPCRTKVVFFPCPVALQGDQDRAQGRAKKVLCDGLWLQTQTTNIVSVSFLDF